MGFLDHSTNNIILDTVLTNTGRQLLARNDGSFAIHKFALGDDEVDYSIIRKYGRSVGREKIEKNTPIFEALTNQTYSHKYKLVSVSNPDLVRLPTISLSGDSNVDSTNSLVNLSTTRNKLALITLEQVIKDESTIDVELRDQTFSVEMSNIFLEVLNDTPEFIDQQKNASYVMTRSTTENSFGGSTLQFTLSLKSLSTSMFQIYGSGNMKSSITTFVKVSGLQSGATKEFKVIIRNDAAPTLSGGF